MSRGALLLDGFSEEDIQWLFANSTELALEPGTHLITEGEDVHALYIVLQGYLAVFIESAGHGQVAALGQGEMVGEMSFLEQKKAAASVKAVEPASVRVLPFLEIEKRIESTPGFGIRFFRSLARLISSRLRGRPALTEHPVNPESGSDRTAVDAERSDAWKKIKTEMADVLELLRAAENDSALKDKRLSDAGIKNVQDAWLRLTASLNATVGAQSHENRMVKDEIGAFARNSLIPYVMQTGVMKRVYTKPRGYAGDCIAIADIHNNTPGGSSNVGIALDRCFLQEPACVAMRSRKAFIAEEIKKIIAGRKNAETLVTCLSGGPADELFDTYQKMARPDPLKSTVIDLDSQAVSFLEMRREKQYLDTLMEIHNENVIYLSTGQSQLNLPPQDFVYSIGLIDYFEDNTVVSLINFIFGILKPKGTVILGNFHPDNPSRTLMDHILDWKYVHRTPEDMQRLFQQSLFKRPPWKIRWDEQKIYVFAECVKPSSDNSKSGFFTPVT
ncbi:MAG: cyclic nucleotide-binding domain-containing protein [Candidatus Hydrogenedentota bacterium]